MARRLLAAGALSGVLPRAPVPRGVVTAWTSPDGTECFYVHTTDVYPASTGAGGLVLALGDLAFLVREVLSARRAELLDLELLGHRPLVLGRGVVRSPALAAGHLDEVAHEKTLSMPPLRGRGDLLTLPASSSPARTHPLLESRRAAKTPGRQERRGAETRREGRG